MTFLTRTAGPLRHDTKPPQGRFDVRRVPSNWRWFWDAIGSDHIVLTLDRVVTDLLRQDSIYPLEGGAAWSRTDWGRAIEFSSDGDEVNLGDRFDMGGSSTGSWGCLIIPAVTTNGKPWGSWDDSEDNQWLIQTSTSITYGVKTEPTGTVTTGGGSITAGTPTYIVGTFEQGVALTGYQDGEQVTQNTGDADLSAAVHGTPIAGFNAKLGAGGQPGETETQYNGQVVLAWATDRLLSADDISRLSSPSADYFAPFRQVRLTYIAVPAAVGGGETVTPGTASIALQGQAPTPLAPETVSVPAADLAFSTFAPTVDISTTPSGNVFVEPGTADLVLQGQAPTVDAPETTAVPSGSTVFTGLAPTVQEGEDATVSVPSADLALQGQAPTVDDSDTVQPATADLVFTTFAPKVDTGANVTVEPGAADLAVIGQAPTVDAPEVVTPPSGSLALNTFAPTLGVPETVSVPAGSLVLQGFAPTVSGDALKLKPPYTAAWTEPGRTADWTDPARTAEWER